MNEVEQTAFNKVDDKWSSHNIGTRLTLVTFIVAYLGSVILSFIIEVPTVIVDTTGWLLFSAFITVTLGLNGVKEVGKIVSAFRGNKTVQKKETSSTTQF